MTDPEDQGETFLQRWSRLKQAAEVPPRDDSEPPLRKTSDADPDALQRTVAQSGVDLTAFDPTSLPPIESISASSDIRAFLAPGVPEGLKRAALRRAWVMDPAIRDFVGVAENQWDFNKPDGITGFGSLELTRRVVAGLFSDPPEETTPPRLADTEPLEQVQVDVHELLAEPSSLAVDSATLESHPKAERLPARVDGLHTGSVEFALPERLDNEALQPIHSKLKTLIPK
jgi:hypothetical protein